MKGVGTKINLLAPRDPIPGTDVNSGAEVRIPPGGEHAVPHEAGNVHFAFRPVRVAQPNAVSVTGPNRKRP